jgi:hypothetical protein
MLKKYILIFSLVIGASTLSFADFGGGGGQGCDCIADPSCDPSCDPDVAVPIDGGISLLVVGGVALGVAYKRRKKNQVIELDKE